MRSMLIAVVILFLTVGGCSSIPFLSKSPSDRFAQYVEKYFSGGYSLQPPADSLHPFPWLEANADTLEARAADAALRDLRSIDTSRLSVADRIDWLQLEASLKRDQRDIVLQRPMKSPIQFLTVGGLSWQLSGDRKLTAKDWTDILRTLRTTPIALEMGRRELDTPPPLWIMLARNTATRDVDFLTGTFVDKVNRLAPDSLRGDLLGAARTATGAITQFNRFLTDSLKPGREDEWSVGTVYYNWLLKNVHFLPYTAESMIEAGWKIHRETKAALAALAHRIDSTKSVKELVEAMKQRHPLAGTIADAYRRASDRVRTLLVTRNLVAIPEPETLLFVPTPPSLRETYAWGGYGGIVDRDGKAVGRFFVTDVVPDMTPGQVEEKLKVQNNGWITVIALHEGYPGHHLQSLYAMKNPSKVRARLGSTYYGEGWALYCEAWMARSGFYSTADDSLAWLQMRLWRTARVIVDPSIHTGKMSYEQAVQFMVDEVGLERSAAEAEVNRYTTWSTQAPSYIIGWLEIESLEQEMKEKLGTKFNEKVFIERLLGVGSLPLDLMKRAVRDNFSDQNGK